jgi:hypothetical protein
MSRFGSCTPEWYRATAETPPARQSDSADYYFTLIEEPERALAA